MIVARKSYVKGSDVAQQLLSDVLNYHLALGDIARKYGYATPAGVYNVLSRNYRNRPMVWERLQWAWHMHKSANAQMVIAARCCKRYIDARHAIVVSQMTADIGKVFGAVELFVDEAGHIIGRGYVPEHMSITGDAHYIVSSRRVPVGDWHYVRVYDKYADIKQIVRDVRMVLDGLLCK